MPGASRLATVMSVILDVGWAWAALAVAAGWLAGTPARGALAAVLALLAATTAYYALDSVLRQEPFALYWPELQRWWLASLPSGRLSVQWAHTSDALGCGASSPGSWCLSERWCR